jgi:hypothetical protein
MPLFPRYPWIRNDCGAEIRTFPGQGDFLETKPSEIPREKWWKKGDEGRHYFGIEDRE